ncbi:MAG: DUF5711 family protein [Lachnospiraceae bacterium]
MKKNIKKIIIISVAVLAVICLATVGVWIFKHRGKTYTRYTVKNEFEMPGNTDASFMLGDEGIIRYTRDGVSSYDSTGKELWNVSYEMSNPIGDACGSYAAVADEGSVNLYILDGTGKVYQITTEHSIKYVSVAGNGVTAVWMDDGTKDYITVYKIDGTKIVDMMTTTDEDGIPIAMDLSRDGTKLVTSYASFEQNQLVNQLTFYNFGEVGSNYVDRLVGLKLYEDRLVADVEFAGNDTVVAFSDKGINIFAMEEYEEEGAAINISSSIKSVTVSDEYIGVVTTNEQGGETAYVYDLKGNNKATKELTESYEHFMVSGSDMIFYGGTSLYIVRIGGNDKAKITLTMDINKIYPVDNKRTYMIVGEKSLQTIYLEQSKESDS